LPLDVLKNTFLRARRDEKNLRNLRNLRNLGNFLTGGRARRPAIKGGVAIVGSSAPAPPVRCGGIAGIR